MPLTDMKLRSLKPGDKSYKVSDSGGLFVAVLPSGTRSWRWKYRFAGKEKLLALGQYPETGLAAARILRDQARQVLKSGQDPSQVRKDAARKREDASAYTFEWYARRYWELKGERWAPKPAAQMWRFLARDIFPELGHRPVSEIKPIHVLGALRKIEARGAIHIAHKVRARCGQIFRFAVSEDRLERDPTKDLRGALKPLPKTKHMAKVSFPLKTGPSGT